MLFQPVTHLVFVIIFATQIIILFPTSSTSSLLNLVFPNLDKLGKGKLL